MYFRSIIEHSGIKVTKFTLDTHSEAGFRGDVDPVVGTAIVHGRQIQMYPPGLERRREERLSEARLKRFVEQAAESLT
jgi:hypothetical protein